MSQNVNNDPWHCQDFDIESAPNVIQISVTNGETFTMKKPLMIRYHKNSIQRKPESFLFTLWKSEATLKSEFDSYQESYEANIQFTQKAKEPFQHYEELIDSTIWITKKMDQEILIGILCHQKQTMKICNNS